MPTPITKFDARQIVLRPSLNMAGTAVNGGLDTILINHDPEIGKLFEDRNLQIYGGGTITNSSGTSLSYGANFFLFVNSNIAGVAPYQIVISSGSSPWNFTADGNMAYIVINRTAQTGTLFTNVSSLPAVNFTNQEVFMLAKRVGTTIYIRDGSSLAINTSGILGNISQPGGTTFGMTSNNNSAGTGGLTVATGTSLFNPYLNIVLGDSYIVNSGAELISVTTLTVNGTLTALGTAQVRVL